jgi:hypothetical protein
MRQLVTMCAAVLVLATAPLHAQHLGARLQWQPEIADTDPRLQQPVEIEVLARAAVPALKLLSDATGVSLSVAPEDLTTVGERKLTIISKGLTLKAIMVQLPNALQECHWDIDTSGEKPVYLLHRNSGVEAMVDKQQAATRAARSNQYQAERAAARLSRLDAARRALRMSPRELARLEETDLLLARAALMPTTREMMEIFLSLPDEEMAEFVETGRLEFSYEDAPADVQRLPQLLLDLFVQYVDWLVSSPAGEQDPLLSFLDMEEVRARLEEVPREFEQSPPPTIILSDDGANIRVAAGDMMFPIFCAPAAEIGELGHFLLTHTGYDYASALDIVQKWQREHQKAEERNDSHAWEKSLGAEPTDARLLHSISLPDGGDQITLLEFQRTVAAQTGLSVVSDFLTYSGVLYRFRLHAEMPLWHILTYLVPRGIEWSLVGNCLVFHDRSWYRRSRSEVPERLLFPLVRKYCAGDLTLDDMCTFITALQRHHGAILTPRLAPAMPPELPNLGLYGVELYAIEASAVLDDEQRAALRSPQGMKLADLPLAARDVVLAGAANPLSSLAWSPEQWEQAVFRLEEAEERDEGARLWASSVLGFELPDGAELKARFRFPRFPSDITYTPLLHAEPGQPP